MAYQSVPQVAEELGISPDKVCDWIGRGELAAVNIAHRAGGKPRWRISEDALAAFLASRSSTPPSPAPKPPRRRRDESVTRYF